MLTSAMSLLTREEKRYLYWCEALCICQNRRLYCFLATMVNTCSLMRKVLHQHTTDQFRITVNKCESRQVGWGEERIVQLKQTQCVYAHNSTEDCYAYFVAATLTSYSENMERGGKYGEGSRGNLKLWQSQKSGMDSFLYRVDENMTASTYSLNKIPERNLESMSSHSAHSIPLYLMPRPNSVAGESLPLSLSSSPVKVEKETEIRLLTAAWAKVWYFFWLNWIVNSVCYVAPYFWLV